jgi:hypothetical protein
VPAGTIYAHKSTRRSQGSFGCPKNNLRNLTRELCKNALDKAEPTGLLGWFVYPCRQEACLLTVLASNIAQGKGRIVVDAAFSI